MPDKTKKELEYESLQNATIEKGRSIFARKEFEQAIIWLAALIVGTVVLAILNGVIKK
jgi:hypothetical protein